MEEFLILIDCYGFLIRWLEKIPKDDVKGTRKNHYPFLYLKLRKKQEYS